jgi:peptidoglycan hydrolase-like protein with peptidoglycan-binding domain
MPPERVLEIQRALVERKFLAEATGVYDNATVEAMKAFQAAEKLPVTGYPTARVLQRLGLSLAPPKPSATSENEVAPNSNQPEKP